MKESKIELDALQREYLGYDPDLLVYETYPLYEPYFEAERILKGTKLNWRDLKGRPRVKDIEEVLRLRALFERKCPSLVLDVFGKKRFIGKKKNMLESTERIYNQAVLNFKPTQKVVYEQDTEVIWERRWSDSDETFYKDYVVYKSKSSPPKVAAFDPKGPKPPRAHRFTSLSGAISFVLIRLPYTLNISSENPKVTDNVDKGEKLYKVNENDPILPRIIKRKEESNCELKNGYIRSTRKLNSGELLILQ